jgi:hypothetical protein
MVWDGLRWLGMEEVETWYQVGIVWDSLWMIDAGAHRRSIATFAVASSFGIFELLYDTIKFNKQYNVVCKYKFHVEARKRRENFKRSKSYSDIVDRKPTLGLNKLF